MALRTCCCLTCIRFLLNSTFRALQGLKQKYAAASKGHDLLKKKADALSMRFRQILKKIKDARTHRPFSCRLSSTSGSGFLFRICCHYHSPERRNVDEAPVASGLQSKKTKTEKANPTPPL